MKNQNFLAVGLLVVGSISVSATNVVAVPLSPHAYAMQRSYSNAFDITGTQVTYSTGTDKLAYNSTQGFITKEMWANLAQYPASYNCWLETGMMKGVVMPNLQTVNLSQVVFQNGHFVGYQSVNQSNNTLEYHDAPYGSTTGVTGPQIYTIEKVTGNGNWRILVNGATALTLNSVVCTAGTVASNYYASGSWRSRVGIETSDSAAVFTNPSVASGWIIRKGSNSYQTVNSPNNEDSNNLGWVSNFSYNSANNANGVGFAR